MDTSILTEEQFIKELKNYIVNHDYINHHQTKSEVLILPNPIPDNDASNRKLLQLKLTPLKDPNRPLHITISKIL